MSKIQASVDTENKKVDITIDGVSVPNACEFSCFAYKDADGNVVGVDTVVRARETMPNGVEKNVTYYAMGSEEASFAAHAGMELIEDVPGFVGVTEDIALYQDIDSFISSKKRGF